MVIFSNCFRCPHAPTCVNSHPDIAFLLGLLLLVYHGWPQQGNLLHFDSLNTMFCQYGSSPQEFRFPTCQGGKQEHAMLGAPCLVQQPARGPAQTAHAHSPSTPAERGHRAQTTSRVAWLHTLHICTDFCALRSPPSMLVCRHCFTCLDVGAQEPHSSPATERL